jgi:hypothetical protein
MGGEIPSRAGAAYFISPQLRVEAINIRPMRRGVFLNVNARVERS